MKMPRDEELMLAVRGGDLSAFEQLVLRHQAEAWRAAYRSTGDAAEAEDLAQKVFLRILEAAGRYKPTAGFRTFFFRILTRLCVDHARKKRPVQADPLPQATDSNPSPAEQAEQRAQEQSIQVALDALPANYRMAVVLRYFDGLTGSEMAEAMGVTPKAVERLLARAREVLEPRLKHLLEE